VVADADVRPLTIGIAGGTANDIAIEMVAGAVRQELR
jgi:hypothetical protein